MSDLPVQRIEQWLTGTEGRRRAADSTASEKKRKLPELGEGKCGPVLEGRRDGGRAAAAGGARAAAARRWQRDGEELGRQWRCAREREPKGERVREKSECERER